MKHITTTQPQPKGNIKSLQATFAYLRPYRWYLFGMFAALIITSSSVLGFGKGLQYLVDQGFSGNNPSLLDNALILMLGITLLLAIATYTRFFLITYVGEKVIADLRRDIYEHIIHLPPHFFEHTKTGEILSRLTTDTTLLQEVVGSSLSIALRNSLLLFGGIILLITTSAKLTLYAIIVVPLVVIPIIILGRKVRFLSRTSQDKVADIASHVEETVNALRTVQAYTQENNEMQHFNHNIHAVLQAAFHRISYRSLLTALVIITIFSAIAVILWVGGRDVLAGTMSAGELSSFIFYAIIVAGALGALSEVVGSLQRAAGATERLFELLYTPTNITDPETPTSLPNSTKAIISFENVSFYYPSRPDHMALSDISLTTKPGETIALVGPSGAGKSTIFQLLLRFYDVTHGTILLDNIPITDLRLKDLRSQFGIVSQEPTIFSGTVKENIAYGNQKASEQEIIAAATQANAYEFIEKLPQKLDCFVGEKGITLSGGQKQRIAIARAILKDPKILLLDEATSALDSESEKLVQNALETLMENRTTFVIAHRLSTVLKADRIIVINDGMIEQIGNHQELLQKDGLYAKLAKIQFELT